LKFKLFIIIFISVAIIIPFAKAFEIQFPGESGFYIGKPMLYNVVGTAGDPKTIGQEGIYNFGPDKITLDGDEYYDCSFKIGDFDGAHFYFGIDSKNSTLVQKGIKFGTTDINIKPAIVAVKYPLFVGEKWDNKNDKTELNAKNIEIGGLKLPELNVKDVSAETNVSSSAISVPAGNFSCLLIETVYKGTVLGAISVKLTQRTWMSVDNVPVKRSFELVSEQLMKTPTIVYDMELSEPNPDIYDLNWDGIVNILDLMIITKNYGQNMQSVRVPNPDIDGNKIVDLKDMEFLIAHFGEVYKK
jgi:hypothetical protein